MADSVLGVAVSKQGSRSGGFDLFAGLLFRLTVCQASTLPLSVSGGGDSVPV
jgi:hypothetical protein